MKQVVFGCTASSRARAHTHTHDGQLASKVTTEELGEDSSLLPSFITKAPDVVENTYFNSSDKRWDRLVRTENEK